jgi:hypothetical protein
MLVNLFNEDREDGCYEFEVIGDGYEGGYQWGCISKMNEFLKSHLDY